MKPIFISRVLSCFFIPASQSARSRAHLLFASRLKKPRRFQLICLRPPSAAGGTYRAQRICGLPGDTLQIKSGTLLVNGQSVDDNLPLTHIFKINREHLGSIRYNPRLSYTVPPYFNTLYVTLNDRYVRDHQIAVERYLLPPGLRDNEVFSTYKQNWNRDNFGPVKVPRDCWFVLDDNRGNVGDSRQFGFIHSSKFIGAIL